MGAFLAPETPAGSHETRFVKNVLWSWAGVFFNLLSGLFLSPYIIHHIGDERYGIWALVFSLVEYYGIVDFGFRSAVLKYSSHFRATGETARMEEVISTALVYFSMAAILIFAGSLVLAHNATRFFRVAPADAAAFRFLVVTVGIGWALGAVFNACTAVIEAHQRFDISNRIWIVNNGARTLGCFVVIWLGHGLMALGIVVLAAQLLGYGLTVQALRKLLPSAGLGPRHATRAAARRMVRYGVRTFVANTSLMVLNQDAPVLIGHFLSATLTGYWAFPMRLLSYSVELVGRMGMVTGARTAELTALGEVKAIGRLAVLVNRYSLTLFLPVALYLSIFGRQLLQVWINPEFARNSAPLLPVLGAGVVIAIAAQYNSSSVLYGLGEHESLARAVLVEAILSLAGLWYVVPRYGLMAAACIVSGLMIISRGFYVPHAVSRHVGMSYAAYLHQIYTRPLLIAVPVGAGMWLLNHLAGEPATWTAVLGGGAATAGAYYALAFFHGLERPHRDMLTAYVAARLEPLTGARQASGAGVP
ncbi:MAG TPA: oligosaccharide flippase family protein [Bryobacteraceae bacterium]|nr:oligosaccharide flippase family protein [Bryobacteraceae bacterium]